MVGDVFRQVPTMVNVVSEPSRGILMGSGAATRVCPRDWEPQSPVAPLQKPITLAGASGVPIRTFGVKHVHLHMPGRGFVVSEVSQPILSVVRLQGLRIQTVFREKSAHLLFPNGKTASFNRGGTT